MGLRPSYVERATLGIKQQQSKADSLKQGNSLSDNLLAGVQDSNPKELTREQRLFLQQQALRNTYNDIEKRVGKRKRCELCKSVLLIRKFPIFNGELGPQCRGCIRVYSPMGRSRTARRLAGY